jgi:membrane protein required for colicin V production
MTTLDILILIFLGIGFVWGLMKGLVKQLASLVGLVAGLLVARALYGMVGEQLAPHLGTSVTVAQIIAFLLIWMAVPLVLHIVAIVLTKALDVLMLGWANHGLGGVAGALVVLLWISILFNVLTFIHAEGVLAKQSVREQSVLYEPCKQVAGLFFPSLQSDPNAEQEPNPEDIETTNNDVNE